MSSSDSDSSDSSEVRRKARNQNLRQVDMDEVEDVSSEEEGEPECETFLRTEIVRGKTKDEDFIIKEGDKVTLHYILK